MWNIATKELCQLFLSPLAWSILAVVQIILGLVFASTVDSFLQPNVQAELAQISPNGVSLTDFIVVDLLSLTAVIILLISPLLTMRLISEERYNKTLPLLLSSPIPITKIILGKYLGLMIFFVIMLLMILLMPLSLLLGGNLDFGQIISAALGLLLFISLFVAIGLYISTLTSHPVVAAISTFGALFILWIINWVGNSTEEKSELFTYLSIIEHYDGFLKGVVNTEDIIYYLLFIALFLILSIQRLDAERY